MKILLFGKNGQVGWELNRSLQPLGEVIALERKDADFSRPESLRKIVREIQPDVIVNAVAFTAVDAAEKEKDLAELVNGAAPGILAEEALKINSLLIHYSTDYVFDGKKTGVYTETDVTNPISVYGKTKLLGEKLIQESGCKHIIFRTSWVYAARGSNFVKTIFRLAKERDELNVVADQFGAPTSAELIADITALSLCHLLHNKVLVENVTGIYHLAATGETSWHGLARYVTEEAYNQKIILRIKPDNIHPITTSEYPLPAKRPSNSRLDTQKLSETFGVYMPFWQTHVQRMVSELVEY
jgi:dTDP-4-dehydrorhamnose reductase